MSLNRTTKVLLVVFLLLAGGLVWFFLYKDNNENPVSGLKPRIEMGIGRINSITDSTIDLELELLVHNPLPIELNAKSFTYQILMDCTRIVENEHPKPLRVPARDSTTITLVSELKTLKIREINQEATSGSDSADYHFEGIFALEKPLLGKDTIRIVRQRRLPRYRLPDVQLLGYDLEKFSLTESEVVLHLEFTNNNRFPIEFKNPAYEIDFGSQENLARGKVPGITKIPGKSTDQYDIPLKINMGDLIKAAGQKLFQGNDLPFKLEFSCTLNSSNEMFKNSDVNVIVEGELKDLQRKKK